MHIDDKQPYSFAMLKRKLLPILIFFLNSCIPYPHFRVLMEKQSGYLLASGKPLAGVKVYQSFGYRDETCSKAENEVLTDANGFFSFPEWKPMSFYIPVADEHYFSSLCTDYKGKRKWLAYKTTNYVARSSEMKYRCDLDTKAQIDYPAGTRKDLPYFPCKLLDSK